MLSKYTMPNSNGLISSKDVSATGDANSNFFVRVGEPIAIPSPLQIISADGAKVGVISEANDGSMSLTTDSQIYLTPGVDSDVVIATEPSVAGNEAGLTITRTLPTTQSCSLHLDQTGVLDISPQQGGVNIFSQGGTRNLNLYCDPTGYCSISNANDGADGEIIINTASATDSKLLLQVRPPASTASGLAITSITNAPTQTAYVYAGGDGSLELSATTNTVRVRAQGDNGNGLIVAPADETAGVSALNIRNGTSSATPTNFVMYNASATGGGLSAGHLQTFGYSNGGATIREVMDCTVDGGNISLGDGSTVGGCVVTVNGTSGASRVYDGFYNPPPAFTVIDTYTTSLTSATSPTFQITTTGLYMINAYIDFNTSLGGSAVIPASGIYKWGLGYGDPAHSAVVTENSANQYSAVSMTGGSTWGYMSAQTIVTLSSNTYEPNQRYAWKTYADTGFSGGVVTLTIYRLA
jgi:hypothetical protein